MLVIFLIYYERFFGKTGACYRNRGSQLILRHRFTGVEAGMVEIGSTMAKRAFKMDESIAAE